MSRGFLKIAYLIQPLSFGPSGFFSNHIEKVLTIVFVPEKRRINIIFKTTKVSRETYTQRTTPSDGARHLDSPDFKLT